MRGKERLCIIVFLLLIICFFQCGTDNKKVLLRLKFNPGQSLTWQNEIKEFLELYLDDSLSSTSINRQKSELKEEVIEIIDSTRVKCKSTVYSENITQDAIDTSDIETHMDSSVVDFIQNKRAVILDLIPSDTTSLEMLEYYEKKYDQFAPRFPDDPVSAGYTWTNTVKVMLKDGEVRDVISNYKVKEFVREAGYDCVIIEYKSNSILPFRYEYDGWHGEGRIVDTRIDKRVREGTLYFAYKKGFILREEINYTFTGEGTRFYGGKERKLLINASGSSSISLIKSEGI